MFFVFRYASILNDANEASENARRPGKNISASATFPGACRPIRCREHNATSFLMGQSSVAYGGTAEKLALLFYIPFGFLDFWTFVD
jgi:hypothetical protein